MAEEDLCKRKSGIYTYIYSVLRVGEIEEERSQTRGSWHFCQEGICKDCPLLSPRGGCNDEDTGSPDTGRMACDIPEFTIHKLLSRRLRDEAEDLTNLTADHHCPCANKKQRVGHMNAICRKSLQELRPELQLQLIALAILHSNRYPLFA